MLYCRKILMLFVMLVLTCVADACILDLTPESLDPGSYFGLHVSANSRIMAVSANREDIGGYTQAGAVYIYEKDDNGSWQFTHRLQSPSVNTNYFFGESVDVDQDSDSIVIFEPGTDSIYLYQKNASNDWDTITPVVFTEPVLNEDFGRSVRICGDTLAIGAPQAMVNGNCEGVVYIYREVNDIWSTNYSQRLLHANSGSVNQATIEPQFGYSISLSDDLLVAGAYTHSFYDPQSDLAGSACVYQKGSSGWGDGVMLTGAITAPEEFGYSVTICNNNTVAVGNFSLLSGKVFVFTYEDGQWSLNQAIAPPTSTTWQFGSDIIGCGDDLYILETWSFTSPNGRIYRYHYDGTYWNLVDTFISPENSFARQNSKMAISDGCLFVGNYKYQSYTGAICEILLDPDDMADFNDDCYFDVDDLTELANGWLTDDLLLDIAPFGGDGVVDMLEMAELAKQY